MGGVSSWTFRLFGDDGPVELLSYNPDTHRVRAQRSFASFARPGAHRASRSGLTHRLTCTIFSSEHLLYPVEYGNPTFDALKENLHEHGQTDPGIVNSSGRPDQREHTLRGAERTRNPHIQVGVCRVTRGAAGYPVDRAVAAAAEGLQPSTLLRRSSSSGHS